MRAPPPARLLEGKVALITGGSRGLGRAMALVFAREGAAVGFSYRTKAAEAAQVVAQITAAGGRAQAWACEVTDRAATRTMFREAEAGLGPIDILVNNAGVGQPLPLALMEDEDWDQVESEVEGCL